MHNTRAMCWTGYLYQPRTIFVHFVVGNAGFAQSCVQCSRRPAQYRFLALHSVSKPNAHTSFSASIGCSFSLPLRSVNARKAGIISWSNMVTDSRSLSVNTLLCTRIRHKMSKSLPDTDPPRTYANSPQRQALPYACSGRSACQCPT